MESGQLDLLRHEIEKAFGRRVLSSADCHQLGLDITHRTHQRISFNTLRRYFNLMKDNHAPSYYTLDVLSIYCGFSSFNEFIAFRNSRKEKDKEIDVDLLNYLVMFFKNTQVASLNDITYFSFVHQTINYLEQHLHMVDAFQREISRTKNGQNYYFEQFINIDKLNSFYGEGLRYYLNEKRTREAQLFGYCLLCFRSWLAMTEKGVCKEWKMIVDSKMDNTLEPAVCGRYFAIRLYYANEIGTNAETVIVEARQFYSFIPPSKYNYSSYYCFEIILAEALILTGNYEEALFYIEEILKKIKDSIPSYIDIALLETILLFKAIAYAQTDRKVKAKEVYETISPNKFYFLSRKYLTILYLSIGRILKHKIAGEEQVKYLIAETGFQRLNYFWKSFDLISEGRNTKVSNTKVSNQDALPG